MYKPISVAHLDRRPLNSLDLNTPRVPYHLRRRAKKIAVSQTLSCQPSFIQRLPVEVLSHIFSCFVEQHRDASINRARIISSICSRWRTIALDTARLWASLVFTLPISQQQLSSSSACLRRSKKHALDISIDFRDEYWNWDEESRDFEAGEMEDVLDIILPHSSRWRSIELLTDTWTPIHTFLTCTQDITAPVLETLSLSRCNAYFARKGQKFEPSDKRAPLPLFGGSHLPGLRQASFVGVHVDWTASKLSNLHSLELKYHASDVTPSFDQFTHIIAACPDLMHLTLLGWGPRLPEACRDRAMVVLPDLASFSFGFVDSAYAARLLSTISTPRLEAFALEDLSSSLDPHGRVDSTIKWKWLDMQIPWDKLHTLELHYLRLFSPRTFLANLSSLRELRVSDPGADVFVALSGMGGDGVSGAACPGLKSIRCRAVHEAESMIDFAVARVGHLENFEFEVMCEDHLSDEQWARLLDISTKVKISVCKLFAGNP